MKELEIKWLRTTTSAASQIYDSGLQYCLVNKDYEQCHPFVYCKDFMQDAIYGHLHGRTASIYDFKYDPKTMPRLSLDRIRIAVVNDSDKKFGDKIPGVVDLLNQIEKKLKLRPTVIQRVSNPPKKYAKTGVYFLGGSGQWLNSPVMVSLYSLMMRVGFSHTPGADFMQTLKGVASGKISQYQSSDKIQVVQALKGIEKILENGYRKFFFIETQRNYPSSASIGTIHNSSGIVSWSMGYTKSICPYWNRNINLSKKKTAEDKPMDGVATTVNP